MRTLVDGLTNLALFIALILSVIALHVCMRQRLYRSALIDAAYIVLNLSLLIYRLTH